ncbi:hypothetical protein P355_3092 [Burkholderia cenocepacia KC-01]|nr:hypothetical protein P355_3092 [Burkholderia cenocepacia KC-01]
MPRPRGRYLCAHRFERRREAGPGRCVVVDHQHALAVERDRVGRALGPRRLLRRIVGVPAGRQRHRDGHAAPGARARRDHLAAVQLRDVAHDRQAEPQTALRRRERAFRPAERVEQVRQVFRRDALPGVGDGQPHALAGARQRHVDAAARRRELDRVRQQVRQDLAQAFAVRGNHAGRHRVFRRQHEPVRLGGRVEFTCGVAHDPHEVDRHAFETQPAGREGRGVEQIGDHVRQRPRAAIDRVDRLLREALPVGVAQYLDPAVDHVQRRAQLVRHRRQQLVLQPVRRVGLHARVAGAAQRAKVVAFVAAAFARFAQRQRQARAVALRVDDRRRGEGGAKTAAVGAHAQYVERPDRRAQVRERRGHRVPAQPARRDHRDDIAAARLGRIDAEDAGRGRIPAGDPARGIGPDDCIGRRVDHPAQQPVAGEARDGRRLAVRRVRIAIVIADLPQSIIRKQRLHGRHQHAFDEADRDERAGLRQQRRQRRVAPPQCADHADTGGGRGEAAAERRQPCGGRHTCVKRQRRKGRVLADSPNCPRLQRGREPDGQYDPCTLPEHLTGQSRHCILASHRLPSCGGMPPVGHAACRRTRRASVKTPANNVPGGARTSRSRQWPLGAAPALAAWWIVSLASPRRRTPP